MLAARHRAMSIYARESMTYGHYSKGERVNLRAAIDKLDYGEEIYGAFAAGVDHSLRG